MLDITLTFPTPEGSQTINIDRDRTSFGRGSEADHRFPDDGLSRLHATVYRDGDRVWVVDENSTNGTFVNGQSVSGSGTPLRDGDTIKIGNNTNLKLRIAQAASTVAPAVPNQPAQVQRSAAAPGESSGSFVPVIIIAVAVLVISVSAVFIGFTVIGSGEPEIVQKTDDDID